MKEDFQPIQHEDRVHLSQQESSSEQKEESPITVRKGTVEDFLGYYQSVVEKYPDRDWIKMDELQEYFDWSDTEKVFLAERNGRVLTALTATSMDNGVLYIEYLISDPGSHDRSGAKFLFKKLFQDYREIEFTAAPFGMKGEFSDEKYEKRRRALMRYYRQFGFEVMPDREDGMRWEKDDGTSDGNVEENA